MDSNTTVEKNKTKQNKNQPKLFRYFLQEKFSDEERVPEVKMPLHTCARFGLDMLSEPRAGFAFYN